MKKKHIKLPRSYNPPGKNTPPESLAYLTQAEHDFIRRMTDGRASMGPKGVKSYAMFAGTSGTGYSSAANSKSVTGSTGNAGGGSTASRSGSTSMGSNSQNTSRSASSSGSSASRSNGSSSNTNSGSTASKSGATSMGGNSQNTSRSSPMGSGTGSAFGGAGSTALGRVAQSINTGTGSGQMGSKGGGASTQQPGSRVGLGGPGVVSNAGLGFNQARNVMNRPSVPNGPSGPSRGSFSGVQPGLSAPPARSAFGPVTGGTSWTNPAGVPQSVKNALAARGFNPDGTKMQSPVISRNPFDRSMEVQRDRLALGMSPNPTQAFGSAPPSLTLGRNPFDRSVEVQRDRQALGMSPNPTQPIGGAPSAPTFARNPYDVTREVQQLRNPTPQSPVLARNPYDTTSQINRDRMALGMTPNVPTAPMSPVLARNPFDRSLEVQRDREALGMAPNLPMQPNQTMQQNGQFTKQFYDRVPQSAPPAGYGFPNFSTTTPDARYMMDRALIDSTQQAALNPAPNTIQQPAFAPVRDIQYQGRGVGDAPTANDIGGVGNDPPGQNIAPMGNTIFSDPSMVSDRLGTVTFSNLARPVRVPGVVGTSVGSPSLDRYGNLGGEMVGGLGNRGIRQSAPAASPFGNVPPLTAPSSPVMARNPYERSVEVQRERDALGMSPNPTMNAPQSQPNMGGYQSNFGTLPDPYIYRGGSGGGGGGSASEQQAPMPSQAELTTLLQSMQAKGATPEEIAFVQSMLQGA